MGLLELQYLNLSNAGQQPSEDRSLPSKNHIFHILNCMSNSYKVYFILKAAPWIAVSKASLSHSNQYMI